MSESSPPEKKHQGDSVLLVDADEDLAQVVVAILTDEGYAVEVLPSTDHSEIAAAVNRLEPDCVLLDGTGADYGASWGEAAFLASRGRAVPTIMFTAHAGDLREAKAGESERATAAGFAALLPKPFSLDELVEAVDTATGRSQRFDRSATGDQARNEALERALADAGATDIRTSNRREWATFRSPNDEHLHQIYWWQQLGVYVVGSYDADARLTPAGRFYDLGSAIGAALNP